MQEAAQLAKELWENISQNCDPDATKAITRIVNKNKKQLVNAFYNFMMSDKSAAQFLSVNSVEQRLKPGLERWLDILFCEPSEETLKAALAMQRHVGEVHARAEIPVALVARGMRLLKHEIIQHLQASSLTRISLVSAVLHVNHMIDVAFEVMSAAYVSSHDQGIRTDESFRMFSAGHNLAMEREKQQGAMLEWENRLFRTMAQDLSLDSLLPIKISPIGLWLRHKAPLMFSNIHELALIDTCLDHIDDSLLPQITHKDIELNGSPIVRDIIRKILAETEQIKYLLNTIFDRLNEMEIGRDPLTQLFNRRFLPTILKREIDISRRKDFSFGALMLDVDFFKRVNDQHGHEAGDRVLQQIAGLIINKVRAGDFAFRFGGEEFLMLLTEIDTQQAQMVAEKIRQRVESAEILLANDTSIRVTLSIGIAMTDGHPDYQRLIERADKALYVAKNTGRNRCVLAE